MFEENQHDPGYQHQIKNAVDIDPGIDKMSEEKVNVNLGGGYGVGMPGGYGGGFGGDGMGGLLALALLGGNGGIGNRNGADAASVALMNAGFDGINHNINTSMIGLTNQLGQGFTNQNSLDLMAKLGTIEGAIPLAEAQVQLALAGSTASINQNIANGLQVAIAGQAGINKNISDSLASAIAGQGAIKETVAQFGVANLNATKDSQFATQLAIAGSTKEILAALNAQNVDNLSRQLLVAENALSEERFNRRSRDVEVNVNQTVTQTQAQAQLQAQQQQQGLVLQRLLCEMAENTQYSRATAANTNFIIGNTGASTTGAQTATPTSTNVNANG